MKRLSIIVPFYNVEKYIAQCLDSLLHQDIPHEEYEIICVDDRSPDGSLAIVQDYMQRYSNIVFVQHSVNQRVGGGRNTGLKHAKGQYVWFVDSDDMIVENCLSHLLSLCERKDLDVLCFNIKIIDNVGQVVNTETLFPTIGARSINGVTFLDEVFKDSLIYNLGYAYRAIYKRSHLVEHEILFPENISYGEDTTYMATAVLYASKVYSLEEGYYQYRQNMLSVTYSLERQYRGKIVFQSIFHAGSLVCDLIHEAKKRDEVLAQNIEVGMPWFVNRLFFRMLRMDRKELKIFYDEVYKHPHLIEKVLSYMDAKNRFSVKNPRLASLMFCILTPIYNLKRS